METRRGKKGSKQTWWSTCQYSYIVHVYNIHTFTLFDHYRYIFCPILLHFLFFIYLFKVFFFKGRGSILPFSLCMHSMSFHFMFYNFFLLFCSWEMKIFDFSLSSINILVSGQNYVKYGQNLDCHSCFATHLQLLYLEIGFFLIGGLFDFNFGEISIFSRKQIIGDNFVFPALQLF